MRISDWSSDVCSSEASGFEAVAEASHGHEHRRVARVRLDARADALDVHVERLGVSEVVGSPHPVDQLPTGQDTPGVAHQHLEQLEFLERPVDLKSEEHTSELQSQMRISYAVF